MSSRQRRKKRSNGLGRKWKLIDDRSGFVVMSDEIRIDHRGRITSKDNWDPIHYSEMVIDYPPEGDPLPYLRPEPADRFIEVVYPTYASTYVLPPATFGPDTNSYIWNTVRDLWNSDNITWNVDPSPPHMDSWGDNYDYWTDD